MLASVANWFVYIYLSLVGELRVLPFCFEIGIQWWFLVIKLAFLSGSCSSPAPPYSHLWSLLPALLPFFLSPASAPSRSHLHQAHPDPHALHSIHLHHTYFHNGFCPSLAPCMATTPHLHPFHNCTPYFTITSNLPSCKRREIACGKSPAGNRLQEIACGKSPSGKSPSRKSPSRKSPSGKLPSGTSPFGNRLLGNHLSGIRLRGSRL